jgi:hypothetical protein
MILSILDTSDTDPLSMYGSLAEEDVVQKLVKEPSAQVLRSPPLSFANLLQCCETFWYLALVCHCPDIVTS